MDKQLRESKAEHKAVKKDPRKARGNKKPCKCQSTVRATPSIFRTERRVASGGCPHGCDNGWI
jgi:hypothetical protein